MKKSLNEELVRISQIMGIKPRFDLLIESTKPVGDILRRLWQKIEDDVSSAELDVRRGNPPRINGKNVTTTDYQQLQSKLRDLMTRINSQTNIDAAWDDFLTGLSADNLSLVSSILRKDKTFVNDVYNNLMKQRIDSVNAIIRQYIENGVRHRSGPRQGELYDTNDIIYSEAELIERISSTMDRTNQTLRQTLQQYGFDSVSTDILEDAMKPKIDVFRGGKMQDFEKLVDGNFTLDELANLEGQEFNPELWQIDWDNFRLEGIDADKMRELIDIVDQSILDKLRGNLQSMQQRAEAMRMLFQQLNSMNSKTMTSADNELLQNIYRAFDSQLKQFYFFQPKMFNDIKNFLKKALDSKKISEDSALKKLVDELEKNVTGIEKAWAFSLVDSKAKDALRAIKDGFSSIDWEQIYKLPLKVFTEIPISIGERATRAIFKTTKPELLTKYQNWLKDSYYLKYPEANKLADLLANNPQGGKGFIKPIFGGHQVGLTGGLFDSAAELPYWGQKYFTGSGKGKLAQLEFVSRSVAKYLRFKLQFMFVDTFFSFFNLAINWDEAEKCRNKMIEYAQKNNIELDPNKDFSEMLMSGELIKVTGDSFYDSAECKAIDSAFELYALKILGSDKESYSILANTFVDVFWRNIPTTIDQGVKDAISVFLFPGLADEIALKMKDFYDNVVTKPNGLRNLFGGVQEELKKINDEAKEAAKETKEAVENAAKNNPELKQDLEQNKTDTTTTDSSTTDSTTTDTLIDDTEQGFKNYLSKLNPPKTFKKWEAKDPDYPTSGFPAYGEATDSTGKVAQYEFRDGNWVEFK